MQEIKPPLPIENNPPKTKKQNPKLTIPLPAHNPQKRKKKNPHGSNWSLWVVRRRFFFCCMNV
jgi:hypothetical protein